MAYLRGRDYVLPADVVDIAPDVLRHRVTPSYEALAEGITADKLVADIMRGVPPPEKVLDSRVAANA
jgi:MoxR-like ATPase